jgi:uracil-DNA glycosylase family 4
VKELKILGREWACQSEHIKTAGSKREACIHCGLFSQCKTPFLGASVPKDWSRQLLLVTEYEHQGTAAKLLRRLCTEAGLAEHDIATVAALRCRPHRYAKPSMKAIRACRPFLVNALSRLKPKAIVAFGQSAAKALFNDGSCGSIAWLRGRQVAVDLIDVGKIPVWVTYDVTSVLHGNLDHADRIVEDLQRIFQTHLKWPKEGKVTDAYVGLDTEFTDNHDRVLSVAIANAERVETLQPSAVRERFRGITKVVGHSVAEDVTSLVKLRAAREEWVRGESLRDSLLIARMANENRGKGNYGVEALLRSNHIVDTWKEKTDEIGYDPSKWPADLMHERCRLDAWAGYVVADDFLQSAQGPLKIAHRIAMSLKRVELAGAFISMETFGKFAKETESKMKELAAQIKAIARSKGMKEFEPSNDHHLRELIFKRMKLTATRFTDKNQEKVDKLTLKSFAKKHKYFPLQLEYNKYEKLFTTYCESLRGKFQPASPTVVGGVPVMWLPTRINPLGARTGRRSSGANPFEDTDETGINYQNWPKQVRQIIVSRWRNGEISDNDYSKLEVILMGFMSGEDDLIDFFLNSPNGYCAVAKELFGKTVEPDTPDYRVVKSTILGVQYCMKKWKLAEQLRDQVGVMLASNWDDHVEEAGKVIDKYLRRFPGIERFQRACVQEVRKTGQVVGALGQTRRLPIPPEPERSDKFAWKVWRRHVGHIENEACNFKIQWLASLVTGTAMLDVEERLLREAKYSYRDYHLALLEKDWPRFPLLINEVHDDLVYDHPPERRKFYAELIHETMQELPTLRRLIPEMRDLPIKVDSKIGPYWGAKK